MLVITTPATDPALASLSDARVAAGLLADDTSKDASLEVLRLRVSADIVQACRIAVGSGAPATLRQETVQETIFGATAGKIVLSRRHEVSILSVAVDGVTLASTYYMADPESGILTRLGTDGLPTSWTGKKTVLSYQAGFATVPTDLSGVALDLIRIRTSETTRDPMLKSERVFIHDVQEVQHDYWVGMGGASKSTTSVPQEIAARLGRYANPGCV